MKTQCNLECQNFPSFDSKTQDIVLQTISSSTLICTHDSYVNTRRCKQLYKYSPVFSDNESRHAFALCATQSVLLIGKFSAGIDFFV